MDAKKFLSQLEKIDRMIENKTAEKEKWVLRAESINSHSNSDRVKSSGSQQKMSDAVVRYLDLEKEIDECIKELLRVRNDIISILENLDSDEYDVLHKIYVQNMSYRKVASVLHRSYSWVSATHKTGIKSVQKVLDERDLDDEVLKFVSLL